MTIANDTPVPASSDAQVPSRSGSAGGGPTWVPVAMLLVMAVLMLMRKRE
jgi:hypothetical protein